MKDTRPSASNEVLRPLEIPVIARRHIMHCGLASQGVESDHAYLLSSLVQQARHYFEASATTSIQVRPLLVYYGMLHLAKAVVLLRDPSAITTVESQKHGLATPRSRRVQPYWRQKVCIQPHGVFASWLRSVLSEYSDPDPSPIPYKEPFPLSSLWACVPDIEQVCPSLDIVPRWTKLACPSETDPWCVPHGWAGRCGLTEDEVRGALGRWRQGRCLRCRCRAGAPVEGSCGAGPRCAGRGEEGGGGDGRWLEGRDGEGDGMACPVLDHPWLSLTRGPHQYLTIPPYPAPTAATAILPEAFVICMILFHASMLVRYDAETWTDLVGDSRSAEHWMFEQLCRTATMYSPPYFATLLGLRPDCP